MSPALSTWNCLTQAFISGLQLELAVSSCYYLRKAVTSCPVVIYTYLMQAVIICVRLELAVSSWYYLRETVISCVKVDLAVSICSY